MKRWRARVRIRSHCSGTSDQKSRCPTEVDALDLDDWTRASARKCPRVSLASRLDLDRTRRRYSLPERPGGAVTRDYKIYMSQRKIVRKHEDPPQRCTALKVYGAIAYASLIRPCTVQHAAGAQQPLALCAQVLLRDLSPLSSRESAGLHGGRCGCRRRSRGRARGSRASGGCRRRGG